MDKDGQKSTKILDQPSTLADKVEAERGQTELIGDLNAFKRWLEKL